MTGRLNQQKVAVTLNQKTFACLLRSRHTTLPSKLSSCHAKPLKRKRRRPLQSLSPVLTVTKYVQEDYVWPDKNNLLLQQTEEHPDFMEKLFAFLLEIFHFSLEACESNPRALRHGLFLRERLKTLKLYNSAMRMDLWKGREYFVGDMQHIVLCKFCIKSRKCKFIGDVVWSKSIPITMFKPEILKRSCNLSTHLHNDSYSSITYMYEVAVYEALTFFVMLKYKFSYEEASTKLGFMPTFRNNYSV